jgi:hypothetical protein
LHRYVEGKLSGGLLQQQEYRVVAFDPVGLYKLTNSVYP